MILYLHICSTYAKIKVSTMKLINTNHSTKSNTMSTIQDIIKIKDNLPNARNSNDLKTINRNNGRYFFSTDSMRFFSSRVHEKVYGGCFFVTSEQFNWNEPRLYTVRCMDNDGNVYTMDEFQRFDTRSQAHWFAHDLAEQLKSEGV